MKTLNVTTSNDCPSRTPFIVLLTVFSLTTVIITGAFVYFHWYRNKQLDLKKDVHSVNYSMTVTQIY